MAALTALHAVILETVAHSCCGEGRRQLHDSVRSEHGSRGSGTVAFLLVLAVLVWLDRAVSRTSTPASRPCFPRHGRGPGLSNTGDHHDRADVPPRADYGKRYLARGDGPTV